MKETFYFRHDYNARNDERILELRAEYGWEGYGIFWAIIESIAENAYGGINIASIGGLSTGLNYTKKKLLQIIDFCVEIGLLINDDGFVHSKRFDEHLEFRGKLADAGREGANKRWENRGANGVAMANPMQSTVQYNKENTKSVFEVSYFENKEINDLFIDHLRMRIKLRAVNSERAIKALITRLEEMAKSDSAKKQIITEAVMNSWKSYYPLKQGNKAVNSPISIYTPPKNLINKQT
jgi:uncharacterized protein YkuJ